MKKQEEHRMKLKAIPVEPDGTESYLRLSYTGGCEITAGYARHNRTFADGYVSLRYFQLKYTPILCLLYGSVTDDVSSLVECIDANKTFEEIKTWFIKRLSVVFYNEAITANVEEMVNNKEIDLQKYLEELEQCYQQFRPIIQKQDKDKEKAWQSKWLEELLRGNQK